jgi:hypothetical protein
MHQIKGVMAVALTLALSACNSQVSDAQKALAREMKDEKSARFRDTYTLTRTTTEGGTLRVVCGEINSKNGYGAYGGYSRFAYLAEHSRPKKVPVGARAIFAEKTHLLEEDEGAKARVELLCSRKDTKPLYSDEYDYTFDDPCGGPSGDITSMAYLKQLVVQKFGKDRTCEYEKGLKDTPNFFSMSNAERTAYRAKLDRMLEVGHFISSKIDEQKASDEKRTTEERKRLKAAEAEHQTSALGAPTE